MDIYNFFRTILNARRGKISLLISLGGTLATIVTARFAYSVGSRFDNLQSEVAAYSSNIKGVRSMSNQLMKELPNQNSSVGLQNNPEVRQVVVITRPTSTSEITSLDSLDSVNPNMVLPEMFLPEETILKADTVKKDTIVISSIIWNVRSGRALRTVTSGQMLSGGSLYTSNVDLAKALDILSKSNQLLTQKLAESEREVSLLRNQTRSADLPLKTNRPD